MDVFYEESAIMHNAQKGERKYKIVHIISNIFLFLGIFATITGVMIIPMDASWIIWGGICFWFFLIWFLLFKWKARLNVSYDYVFVTGELRISRVININKRRLITRFNTEEILQIGDIENSSYERLKSDPMTKEVICTSNEEPAEGKFFMYILVNDGGKKLYILECRELMLMNILKFAKRSALENDYVMQEKKQKKV